jgi:hypothetical protein
VRRVGLTLVANDTNVLKNRILDHRAMTFLSVSTVTCASRGRSRDGYDGALSADRFVFKS